MHRIASRCDTAFARGDKGCSDQARMRRIDMRRSREGAFTCGARRLAVCGGCWRRLLCCEGRVNLCLGAM